MGFFLLAALIIIAAGAVYIGLGLAATDATEGDHFGSGAKEEFDPTGWRLATLAAAAVVLVFVTSVCATDNVDSGKIGIKKQFSAVTGTPTGDGLAVHAPWQSIVQVSVQNDKRTYKMGEQGINTGNVKVDVTGGSAVSKDSQAISLFLQVNYTVKKECAVELYRSTGGHYLERILDNAVFQHAKSETAEFAATEFAANREKVRQNIENSLAKETGGQCIRINNVALLDVGYSPGLSAAIEKTVEANQRAKAAQAQVAVVKAEADQRVARANGNALATVTEAKAKATAQKLQNKTLTPLLVQQNAVDKLNPNVSVIVCSAKGPCIPQAVLATAGK